MNVGVIGGSGYAGGELLRLLAGHPHFHASVVTAHSNAGESISTIHPHLQSYGAKKFENFTPERFEECELIFLALPHGQSQGVVERLSPNAKVVDLGADFRLENPSAWNMDIWPPRAFSPTGRGSNADC